MDKNQGYEIIQAVMLENGRGFALGHNPAAPSPYVTWACYDDKDGQRQYECQAGRGSRPLQVLLYPAPRGHWNIPQAVPQRPG